MSTGYQVIARKWRPQTFDDVVGQDHVVRTLKNAIARQRIAHAYLFVGPRGTGKTSTARIFAKALNCTGGPKADFDPADPACVAIAEGSHLDVIEIDGASNNGVDQVRDLRDTVQYAPAQGKYKVYIIDEVHMLSAAAFNALLKTLEEPPAHVKFVFATTDPQKVLPTIISRCQRFDLKPIPGNLIIERLKRIATDEKIKITAGALECIARMADGGMRDAQSILDQMISFCGGEIDEPDVLDVYGLVSAEKIAELASALAAGDHQKLIAIVDECDANGRDLVRLLSDLQAHVRTALLDAIAQGGKSAALGTPLTTEQVTRLLDGLREGEGAVKLGLAEKINFEVTLLKAVDASRARAIDSLIKELSAIADEAPAGDEKKGLIDRLEARLEAALAEQAASGPSPASGQISLTKEPEHRIHYQEIEGAAPVIASASDGPAAEPEFVAVEGVPASESINTWPDESSESAFLAEARGRGEPTKAAAPVVEEVEDRESAKALPKLEDLVQKIPAETREILEDLFRAKFVAVRRVKKADLKNLNVPTEG